MLQPADDVLEGDDPREALHAVRDVRVVPTDGATDEAVVEETFGARRPTEDVRAGQDDGAGEQLETHGTLQLVEQRIHGGLSTQHNDRADIFIV